MAEASTGMDKAAMRQMVAKARHQPINAAMGLAGDGKSAALFFDLRKSPKACEKLLTDSAPGVTNTRWGTASVSVEQPKLLQFQINRPVSGLARKLAKTLKGTGISKVEILLEDGTLIDGAAEEEEEAAAAGAPAPPAPEPATAAGPNAGELHKALAELIPRIPQAAGSDAARKAELVKLASLANVEIKTNNLAYAAAHIEQLRGALEATAPAAAPPPPPPPPRAIKLADVPKPATTAPPVRSVSADGRRMWLDVKNAVDQEIAELQDHLVDMDDPDLQAIGRFGMSGRTGRLNTRLNTALIEIDTAPPDRKEERRKAAKEAVKAYREFLDGDRLFTLLEQNPFGVKVDIVDRMSGALDRIDRALGR